MIFMPEAKQQISSGKAVWFEYWQHYGGAKNSLE